MSLIKNEIPVLEYDTDQNAVFMPEGATGEPYPETAVMLFMDKEVDDYVEKNDCKLLDSLNCIPKMIDVWQIEYQGKKICFCKTPLGGPAAAQMMEMLYAKGVRRFLASGCCGALVEGTEGEFYIPTAALRQEGTSYQYLPPAREVHTDAQVNGAIKKAVESAGYSCKECKTWTTDALFRETKEMVNYRRQEGYVVVDMECASMAACAQMRGAAFGQLLFTADSLADENKHDTRGWGADTFATALKLVFDAASGSI